MTNKDIAARIEAAGHTVPANLNRAKLEALAAEKGVSLEENADAGAADRSVRPPQDYDPSRMITPVMAVCAIAGDTAAVSFPEMETPE